MSTLADIRADLRDVLKDTNVASQKWTDAQLNTYINRGIHQLYPEVYLVGGDTSQTTNSATRRYALPADCPTDGLVNPPVRQVYIAPLGGSSAALFMLLGGWDPNQEEIARGWDLDLQAKQLILMGDYGTGRTIRLVYQKPIPTLALDTDVFAGSDSARDAVLSYAEGQAFRQRERPAISDPVKLGNLLKLQQAENADFNALLRGPGGAAMAPIPMIR